MFTRPSFPSERNQWDQIPPYIKGKGIRLIVVLYPPKCSHDLPFPESETSEIRYFVPPYIRGIGIRLIVVLSSEMFTRPYFPSCEACIHGDHFNPPIDIPEQLAAYSSQARSTALLKLGTHFAAG